MEEIIYELNEYNVDKNTALETALKFYVLKLAERLNQLIETYNILNKVSK